MDPKMKSLTTLLKKTIIAKQTKNGAQLRKHLRELKKLLQSNPLIEEALQASMEILKKQLKDVHIFDPKDLILNGEIILPKVQLNFERWKQSNTERIEDLFKAQLISKAEYKGQLKNLEPEFYIAEIRHHSSPSYSIEALIKPDALNYIIERRLRESRKNLIPSLSGRSRIHLYTEGEKSLLLEFKRTPRVAKVVSKSVRKDVVEKFRDNTFLKAQAKKSVLKRIDVAKIRAENALKKSSERMTEQEIKDFIKKEINESTEFLLNVIERFKTTKPAAWKKHDAMFDLSDVDDATVQRIIGNQRIDSEEAVERILDARDLLEESLTMGQIRFKQQGVLTPFSKISELWEIHGIEKMIPDLVTGSGNGMNPYIHELDDVIRCIAITKKPYSKNIFIQTMLSNQKGPDVMFFSLLSNSWEIMESKSYIDMLSLLDHESKGGILSQLSHIFMGAAAESKNHTTGLFMIMAGETAYPLPKKINFSFDWMRSYSERPGYWVSKAGITNYRDLAYYEIVKRVHKYMQGLVTTYTKNISKLLNTKTLVKDLDAETLKMLKQYFPLTIPLLRNASSKNKKVRDLIFESIKRNHSDRGSKLKLLELIDMVEKHGVITIEGLLPAIT
ncbi:MAG: hypothetical protein WC635_12215 [Bacteriovorax sp.]|jgi:hypothetical protein